jgi:2-polyprenyl-6-methoxyphenol hydroxylase-like FAD-dependent oxidoreductase
MPYLNHQPLCGLTANILIVKGSGGNLAIKDSLDLASLIANSGKNIPDFLQEYASLAIPRAAELVLESRRRTEIWTGDNN